MLRVSAYDISRLKGLDGVLVDVSIDKQASKTMINHSMAQMHVDMVKDRLWKLNHRMEQSIRL